MACRRPTGIARGRQIEAAPEEVDRAGLTDEAALERLHDPIGLAQAAPEQRCMPRVVGGVLLIDFERHGVQDLVRRRRDPDLDAQAAQPGHQLAVEGRDRHRLEGEVERPAVAVGDL